MDAMTPERPKVFVSYSRRDSSDFAEELVAGLELAGFAPFLDRHDIAAGEDWEKRLDGLIQEADTVVFVVSPEAIKSERCNWEVDKTVELSKRLLPVTFKPVPDAEIPEKLRQLQFVRFGTGQGMTRPLSQLAEALRQDVDWIREHTRIGELAARWRARGRPESLLLRGDDLAAARSWAATRKPAAQEITEPQRAFLNASQDAETARRRRTQILAAAAAILLAIVASGVFIAEQQAARMREEAVRAKREIERREVNRLIELTRAARLRGNVIRALRFGIHAARFALASDQEGSGFPPRVPYLPVRSGNLVGTLRCMGMATG
jgi:TIR domain